MGQGHVVTPDQAGEPEQGGARRRHRRERSDGLERGVLELAVTRRASVCHAGIGCDGDASSGTLTVFARVAESVGGAGGSTAVLGAVDLAAVDLAAVE